MTRETSLPRATDGSDIVSVVVGTAGHINHGKSTLVKMLTGIDPDRLKEERENRMTTDLGFARFDLPDGRTVGVIDVPGHEHFVKNMVAGATGIDVVMLVVAANDGIMLQTREHLDILTLLGVEHGLVVVTKIDLVDEDLVGVVILELADLLRGTFLENAPVCPISSTTQKGFPEFKAALAKVVGQVRPRDATGAFRMPIQRVFSSKGHGTVLTGIPLTGQVKIGDPVEVLPPGATGKVRGIQAYSRDLERARAGHSTALNVTDVDWKAVQRGMAVCAPGVFTAEQFLEARLTVLARRRKPLRDRTMLRIHVGTAEVLGEVVLLEGAKTLAPGISSLCQLRLTEPVVFAPGDKFIARLHSPLETIGGGTLLGASKHRLKAGKAFVIERLTEKEAALENPDDGLLVALDDAKKALRADAIAKLVKRPKAEIDDVLSRLSKAEKVVDVSLGKGGPAFVSTRLFEDARAKAQQVLREKHQKRPHKLFVPRADLRATAQLDDQVLDVVLKKLEGEGTIVVTHAGRGGRGGGSGGLEGVRLSEHQVQLQGADAEFAMDLVTLFMERGYAPPGKEEAFETVAGLALENPGRAQEIFHYLLERGDIVQVHEDIYFEKSRYEDARKRLVETLGKTGFLLSSAFKDDLGTSRKYAIPLLEHFDEVGLTVREGDGRVLRKN
ncbi:selenocysteine-specific translation elongation factor [bacterium]|nr:selenocysteine-specific translation elongation factor [bacterium]